MNISKTYIFITNKNIIIFSLTGNYKTETIIKGRCIMNKSTWESRLPIKNKLKTDIKTNVAIIGAGIAGILTAKALKEKGIDCVILEAKAEYSGVTQYTTAKITSQHNLIYNKLIKNIGHENAKKYLIANENAIKSFKKMCKNIDCDFIEASSFVYSLNDEKKIEQEVSAVTNLGVKAKFTNKVELPFKVKGAIEFKNQAYFNPIKFLQEIKKGLTIYNHTMVYSIDNGNLITDGGNIRAENIIVTTHFPFLDKHGFYPIKMFQQRSYVIALKNAQIMHNMYIDEKEGGLSFRPYKDFILLGGKSHRTGKGNCEFKSLYETSKQLYPKSLKKYQWATQDCITLDGIPYIGKYSRSTNNLFVATGFNKWGMTSSMVSSMILTDMICGKQNDFENVFTPQRFSFNKQFFVNLGEIAKSFLTPTTKRCSHLGCALKYNKQEHSWDCSCHGSRFDTNGNIINNPTTKNINVNK